MSMHECVYVCPCARAAEFMHTASASSEYTFAPDCCAPACTHRHTLLVHVYACACLSVCVCAAELVHACVKGSTEGSFTVSQKIAVWLRDDPDQMGFPS